MPKIHNLRAIALVSMMLMTVFMAYATYQQQGHNEETVASIR